MRLAAAAALGLSLPRAPGALAQKDTCDGVSGRFKLTDITGPCTYDKLLDEYADQVFDAPGATSATCAAPGVTAKTDFDAKLKAAYRTATGEEGGLMLCRALYDSQEKTPFTKAADKGKDLHFEQQFYNGLGDWQDEVETLHEPYTGNNGASHLKTDGTKMREFFEGEGSYSRVQWPETLTNFDPSTCSAHAAYCYWPKDRQANDNNGNCAKPYDENCVDKDVADNANLCFSDFEEGDRTTGFKSNQGFAVFPGDNGDGEGSVHCHGFAWTDDEYDVESRYKANNLFFVSMYDHLHQRGYVKQMPGAPMCACIDQMPISTRCDCTQTDLTEDWEVAYDGASFVPKMVKVEIDFNSCQGRNNQNNNLWAYAARLYDEGRMTATQFGKVGRKLTNDQDCYHAVENAKHKKGFITGYNHDEKTWTLVAGRDNLYQGEPLGRGAFNKALFQHSLTKPPSLDAGAFSKTADPSQTPIIHRICPGCISTHQNVYYRRLTPAPAGVDILNIILRWSSSSRPNGNRWNTDFTLHSTYEDAKSGANPWKCRNGSFNYRIAFVGDCSPSGAQKFNQHSNWQFYPGPQPHVAFYVNKPEDEGLQDYIDPRTPRSPNSETDVSIGAAAGNTLHKDGVFHISSKGGDVWAHSDAFQYLSKPGEGDVDVRVRVSEISNTGNRGWTKAGIMLRSDESADATYIFSMLTLSEGIAFQNRRSKGGHAHSTITAIRTNPPQKTAFLRILKKMEKIELYVGDERGDNWVMKATTNIFFPEDSYRVGLAVASTGPHYTAEAAFSDYTVETYNSPTAGPTSSTAPTAYDRVNEINTQRAGSYTGTPGGDETFAGSGTRIWGGSDSFYLNSVRAEADADFKMEMQIWSFGCGQVNCRGGLMIRESTAPGAANAFIGAAGARQGAVFQSRAERGQPTVHHKMVFVNNENRFYVKLVKTGSTVTAYFRKDPADEWTELGSVNLTLTEGPIQVGRAVTAGRDYQYALETMQVKNYTFTGL